MFNKFRGASSVHIPDSIVLGAVNLVKRKGNVIIEKESLPTLTCGPSQKFSASPKQRGISGSASHPTEKGDAFPTPGRRQCTHKYIMVWDVFGNFPRFGGVMDREKISLR
ncbi:hypothetical protein TNCV_2443671 [Trichonephila clavipes]|nr:hypothetical protein TNCV_2443671 [Trichonephila clavipes]